jgi:hypothetical protein
MRTPPQVIAYRSVIAAIMLLIVLSFGLGLAGYGPLGFLHLPGLNG